MELHHLLSIGPGDYQDTKQDVKVVPLRCPPKAFTPPSLNGLCPLVQWRTPGVSVGVRPKGKDHMKSLGVR